MNIESSSRKLLVSVHIPKTAGTSLMSEIKRGVFGNYIFDNVDRPTSMRLQYKVRRLFTRLKVRKNRERLLQEYGVIHGHFLVRKYVFLYPFANYLTFMREPVSRVLSHYYYFKHIASKNPTSVSRNPDIMRVARGDIDLVEFARLYSMVNLYQLFVGGLPLDKFTLIGITERYTESIALLNHIFNTAIEPRHEHRTDYTQYAAEYTEFLPELRAANRENFRIYDAAVRIFEQRLSKG
jgi:hypothetical protein